MRRMIAAFKFNEPQISSCLLFSLLGCLAAWQGNRQWWLFAAVIVVPFSISYTVNLISGPPPSE